MGNKILRTLQDLELEYMSFTSPFGVFSIYPLTLCARKRAADPIVHLKSLLYILSLTSATEVLDPDQNTYPPDLHKTRIHLWQTNTTNQDNPHKLQVINMQRHVKVIE